MVEFFKGLLRKLICRAKTEKIKEDTKAKQESTNLGGGGGPIEPG